jgi:hypothetical protein
MEFPEMQQPNAIIFRLPDDDEGNAIFAEVAIKADGTLDEGFQAFGVDDDDSFNDMEFSTLVLVLKEDENSSIELAAFDIADHVTGDPAILFEAMDNLDPLVPTLIEAYNNGAGITKQ